MREFHRELPATRRQRTQLTDVTEHVGQGCIRLDAHTGRTGVLRLDHAAATIEVTDNITDIVFGGEDIDLHDWFQKLRSSFRHRLSVGSLRCDLKCKRRGVNCVVGAIQQREFDIQ